MGHADTLGTNEMAVDEISEAFITDQPPPLFILGRVLGRRRSANFQGEQPLHTYLAAQVAPRALGRYCYGRTGRPFFSFFNCQTCIPGLGNGKSRHETCQLASDGAGERVACLFCRSLIPRLP